MQAIVLSVIVLYFGRPVLLPLVTALLLTFLLRPAVLWLERHRLPRAAAVAMIVLGILLVMMTVGWTLTRQFQSLASNLDDYRGHLGDKVKALQPSQTAGLRNLRELAKEASEAVGGRQSPADDDRSGTPTDSGEPSGPDPSTADERASRPPDAIVKVVPESSPGTDAIWKAWDLLSTPLATTIVVIVLVIFMLVGFEDLRNRLLRVAGETRLTLTTKTLDDIGRRVSRYLLMNALVNGGFGLCVFAGLSLIGVEYAALWGFLAALFRFVPYVGAFVSLTLPFGMAVIQFPGWTSPLLVVGLFVTLELVTNNLIEPLTYGKAAGISTVALLIAATFWSWIWGPMGLVLSVPLIVVLAVIGRHVPQLEALSILLGDEPALSPAETLYQRLLAGDPDEAALLVDESLATGNREAVYDEIVIPAVVLAERDSHRGVLSDDDKTIVWNNLRDLIEEHHPDPAPGPPEHAQVTIAGFPARDFADELGLTMLEHVASTRCRVIVEDPGLMASEKIAALAEQHPDGVLISSIGAGDASHARYLCKRIRQEHPRLRIIVAYWGYRGDRERLSESFRARGADQLVTTLAEARDVIERIQPIPLSA